MDPCGWIGDDDCPMQEEEMWKKRKKTVCFIKPRSWGTKVTSLTDLLALLSGQGVLKTLSKDDSDWQTVSELVGTLRRSGSPDTSHLGEVPVGRRMEALQVLLGSASPALKKRKMHD